MSAAPPASIPAAATASMSVTLVTGGRAGAREAAIAAALAPGLRAAVILEGLADANGALADPTTTPPAGALQVQRIAPGCLCCTGNLVLRVTLNRILRHPPQQLFISLADVAHVAVLRAWLSAPPYDGLLRLVSDLRVPDGEPDGQPDGDRPDGA